MGYYYICNGDVLYHHGIKGQKWGVRRFQNKDGSFTPAGRKRYDDDEGGSREKKQKQYKIPENKSLHRLKIEDEYKKQGMSKEQAEQAAAKRIRGEQYVAAAAVVTAAAAIAYYNKKKYSIDKVLSADTEFQRVMRLSPDAAIQEGRQYLSYDKRDNRKYRGQLAEGMLKNIKDTKSNDKVYNVSVKAKQDIKIASEKRARETFAKLYKEDSEFRKSLERIARDGGDDIPQSLKLTQEKLIKGETLDDKRLLKRGYDLFNVSLADNTDEGKARAQKFYNALKEQGMNAIYDMNDKKYSGYNAKAPIITFDGVYDYSKKVLENKDIVEALKKPPGVQKSDIAAGAAFVAYLGGLKIKSNRAIEKYKIEHPNTKLTDKEIKDLLKYGE